MHITFAKIICFQLNSAKSSSHDTIELVTRKGTQIWKGDVDVYNPGRRNVYPIMQRMEFDPAISFQMKEYVKWPALATFFRCPTFQEMDSPKKLFIGSPTIYQIGFKATGTPAMPVHCALHIGARTGRYKLMVITSLSALDDAGVAKCEAKINDFESDDVNYDAGNIPVSQWEQDDGSGEGDEVVPVDETGP
jgi:hypothetical protein